MIVKLYNSLDDTTVHNMLVKPVCLTNASIAVHSNIIERIMKYESYALIIIYYHTIKNPIG